MAALPLSTLLSQVLVAFTIELDNEFERLMPHRTSGSTGSSRDGPWLVSLVMYSNLMRCVGDQGVTVAELQRVTRIPKLSLAGMERWGYITVQPAPADTRPKPPQRDWVVRTTEKGRRAKEVWRPLFGVIEKRWRARFGEDEIGRLRESLSVLVNRLDMQMPEFLPVLGYGMTAEILPVGGSAMNATDATLPALLSKVLLAFTLEFERESHLSLAISANVLRILNEKGVRVRDLPRLSGVSKEAIAMSVKFFENRAYIVVQPDPAAARIKLVRLTAKGLAAQQAYRRLPGVIEERWQARWGLDNVRRLRESLEQLSGEPLFLGLEPHPNGWRASVPKPETLPHHPMVLHRGGYPDGS